MKAKSAKALPPAEEWDFRAIDPVTLPGATLYEHARSTTKLRAKTEAWLASEIAGKAIRDHLFDAAREARRKGLLDCTEAATEIIETGWRSGIPSELLELITDCRPDFPNPWLKFPVIFEKNPSFSRVVVSRESREILARHAHLIELGSEATNRYMLTVDWEGATTEEIVDHMARWIRFEARKQPIKKRGAPAQAQTWKLKALSALRLREAGFTFEAAQREIVPLDETEEKRRILPIFADNAGWTDAINAAKAELQRIESLGF